MYARVKGRADASIPKTALISEDALPVLKTNSAQIAMDATSFVNPKLHSFLNKDERSIDTPI